VIKKQSVSPRMKFTKPTLALCLFASVLTAARGNAQDDVAALVAFLKSLTEDYDDA